MSDQMSSALSRRSREEKRRSGSRDLVGGVDAKRHDVQDLLSVLRLALDQGVDAKVAAMKADVREEKRREGKSLRTGRREEGLRSNFLMLL